jgi:transcription initiation factor TFIIB
MCNGGRLITESESGETLCSSCGLVLSDKGTETRAEWRTFDSEKNDRIRTGSPASLAFHDMGLATVIGRTDIDSSGRKLAASMQPAIQRLRTWDFRIQASSSRDRSLMQAFQKLDRLKDKLGLSDPIIEKTAYIYRKAQERGLARGRSISSILAAAIYIACREMEATRTLRDIADGVDVKRKDVSRSYRLIVIQLDIKTPLMDPIKCIVKIANKAKVSEKSKRMAIETMKALVKKEISAGKLPMGLAATALYLSCINNDEKNITQKDIADASGVTEVTIRNRIKDLKARLLLN